MESKQEIRDRIAKKYKYKNWLDLHIQVGGTDMDAFEDEVSEEYNKLRFEEAIKEIEERRDSTHPENRYFMVMEILKSKL